jgi:poly-gamma-glutamate capsule biosynthesis protein CapA/YwtB (metallophosphatase superfamily)
MARSLRLVTLAVVALFVGACGSSTPLPTAAPGGSFALPTAIGSSSTTIPPTLPAPTYKPSSSAPVSEPTPTPSGQPTSTPSPTPPSTNAAMPFVPVVNFWSTRTSMPMDEVKAALRGTSDKYSTISVPTADADALAAAAGVALGSSVQRGSVDDVIAAVKAGGLGFLRASDVQPSVHALGIDDANLFGEGRIKDIGQWPLSANVASEVAWDQGKNWVLVSAGDIMGDRGVRTAVEAAGKGPSYLLDGGTSKVDRIKCCSFFGYQYPVVSRTGNAGAVAKVIQGADFAMANLETGVLPNPVAHGPTSFTFTTDPSYLQAVKDFGFDLLSDANNHAKNGGARALSTAMSTLDQLGILHAGAGVGPDAAAQAVVTTIDGEKVAIIACDAVNRGYWAKPGVVGTNSCREGSVTQTIHQIRDSVDVIIVFPHWGIEYEQPVGYQFDLARDWFDAGADMVVGSHNHFPGGIYDYNGHVAMLSMGNFIFDQSFRQTTLQGLVVETTWNGNKPVQIWVHPLLNVDAQPNFADPDTDGQWAFDVMKWQSEPGKLDWGGSPPPDFGNTPPK